jgi:hypothetical protein
LNILLLLVVVVVRFSSVAVVAQGDTGRPCPAKTRAVEQALKRL